MTSLSARDGKTNGRPFFDHLQRGRARPFPHEPGRPTRRTVPVLALVVLGMLIFPYMVALLTPPRVTAPGDGMRDERLPTLYVAAFDAAVESERTGTSDPHSWVHSPVGTPRAIIVMTAHGITATHHVLSCTYGGVAMTIEASAEDTVTEPGAVRLLFLGASIPTGAQTVSCDLDSGTTDDIHFVSMSFTGAANMVVVATAIDEENQANPTATLAFGGQTSISAMIFYSGAATPPATTACSGSSACTLSHTFDMGAFGDSTAYQTTAGTTNQVMGWTQATDDVAVAYAAITDGEAIPEFTDLIVPVVLVLLVAVWWRRR